MATCRNCGGTWYPASYSSPAEPCDCTELLDQPTTKDETVDSGSSDDPRFAGEGE